MRIFCWSSRITLATRASSKISNTPRGTYPPRDKEAEIIAHESDLPLETALDLAKLGEKVRHLKASGLEEGVSTRLLIYSGQLIRQGVTPRRACTVAVSRSLTDDNDSQRAIDEVINAIFPE